MEMAEVENLRQEYIERLDAGDDSEHTMSVLKVLDTIERCNTMLTIDPIKWKVFRSRLNSSIVELTDLLSSNRVH